MQNEKEKRFNFKNVHVVVILQAYQEDRPGHTLLPTTAGDVLQVQGPPPAKHGESKICYFVLFYTWLVKCSPSWPVLMLDSSGI